VAIPDRRAAYEDLLRRYVTPLRRLASSYERDPPACEDLFQEIALALWTALPGFRGDSSECTWLYRVAHNTAITFATRRRRARSREQSTDEVPEPARGATQERDVLDQQRRARLWAAIHELPLGDRQLIVLHLEGLSAQEVETRELTLPLRVHAGGRVMAHATTCSLAVIALALVSGPTLRSAETLAEVPFELYQHHLVVTRAPSAG
jgi:RNA polymerase sigma factor (sigma-70 family)